jgi:hypothetical protein
MTPRVIANSTATRPTNREIRKPNRMVEKDVATLIIGTQQEVVAGEVV